MNSKTNDTVTSSKEVIEMSDKKDSNCGGGCLPEAKKGAKIQKPEVKKSEKSKS